MVKIIIDSTCDLPDEMIREYGIKIIPLRVYLNGNEYKDKIDINVDEVYNAMKNGIMPMTSQPSPNDIYAAFKDCCKDGSDFIYLAFSSKLSCTYQLAVSICKDIKMEHNDIKMEVVDSLGGSTATGLIALQAAKLAHAGYSFETILNQVKILIKHVEHIFTIKDLSWLVKGGRISKSQGLIGNILDIKPILDVKDGLIEIINKVRGRKKALNAVVDLLTERIKNFPDQIIGISHADDLDTALELIEAIKQRIGEKAVIINKIGSVLGTHLGIGGVGVFFFNKKPDLYIE